MGVDFITCAICKYNFPDCGDYYFCEECGNYFCSRACAKPELLDEDDEASEIYSCCLCRFENIPDHQMVEFLLKKLNVTHDEAKVMFKEENEKKKEREEKEDEFGHLWGMGWVDSDKPHPGFGGTTDIFGCYVGQCEKCGMYSYEFIGGTGRPGKYEGQFCGPIIRKYR